MDTPNPRLLDLFSGVGGMSLGLESAGFQTVAFCEIEPFCQAILQQHWPTVPIIPNIKELTYETLQAQGIAPIDIIAGGFPCQDISSAGGHAGLNGERSGLWRELARLVGETGPRWVLVENVSNLRAIGLETVLADLATLGFDAEWHSIPAAAVGAPHRRDRVWILAHAQRFGRLEHPVFSASLLQQHAAWPPSTHYPPNEAVGRRYFGFPPYLRMGDGIPAGLDEVAPRLKAMGNAVVPQVVEAIGWALRGAECAPQTM